MADRWMVEINLPRLIENLLMSDTSIDWDEATVKDWLRQEGFVERPDGKWLVDGVALARLDRTEVLSQRREE